MIWVNGAVVSDDALKISINDRTFEHGLGLFETLRTWNGLAPLLDRHLARMARSARELGLNLPPILPDAGAVKDLLKAENVVGDVLLRITLTGGPNESQLGTLWMRTGTLPFALNRHGAVVDVGNWEVARDDPFARHKSLNYWSRRQAFERARRLGFDETLSITRGDDIWEGSRTNLFAVRGSTLITPTLDGPIVPGVMRALVEEEAKTLRLSVETTFGLTPDTLSEADEVFLTNSVRGIIPVARLGELSWPLVGEWTRRLQIVIADRMNEFGTSGGLPP